MVKFQVYAIEGHGSKQRSQAASHLHDVYDVKVIGKGTC